MFAGTGVLTSEEDIYTCPSSNTVKERICISDPNTKVWAVAARGVGVLWRDCWVQQKCGLSGRGWHSGDHGCPLKSNGIYSPNIFHISKLRFLHILQKPMLNSKTIEPRITGPQGDQRTGYLRHIG